MPFIPIDSIDDDRIAAYQYVRERDVTGRNRQFIAEGRVVLQVLLHSSYEIESVFLSEKQTSLIDELPYPIRDSVPIYVAPQAIMNSVVGFPIHRGILALGKKPTPLSVQHLLRSLPHSALALGLIGLTNHDNVGGIFRNAAAFGCSAVVLDQACCDPFYRKSLRVSVGGVLKVPFTQTENPLHMVEEFEQQSFQVFALSPSGDLPLANIPRRGKTVLLLGAEGAGLPDTILERVKTVHISMVSGFDSLNVATTSGIALYEMTKL